MKKNLFWVGLIALAICVSVAFLSGCAKKAGVKSDTATTQEQKAVAKGGSAGTASAQDDAAAARERALREKELKEQAERERAAQEAAAKAASDKAAKEAADKAKKEAADKAKAILKELQISDIYFDYDKYNLTPAAQEILKAGAPAYLKHVGYKLIVEGHCDERGTAEYNLALGQKRADEAAKYLVDLGIAKDRVRTISYGEEMPLAKESNEAAWAKNRRAHFVIFPPVK